MLKHKRKKEWIRTFEISEPVKHEKGHMIYEVTSWLFPAGFPEASTKLVTKKRFSDFQKLHKSLSQIHKSLYLSGTMPPLPKANYFNRNDPNVLSVRRSKCLELLEFSAQHPQLYNSQVFLNFFATLFSPSSLNSDEDIGQLMDQGQIMEAAMATTKIAKDLTPVLEPDKPVVVENATDHDTEEAMPAYLNEAANVIKKAIECESDERYDESVACYKKAIGTLLTSLPKDRSLKRQASVKRRIAQYISKAENLSKIVEKKPSGLKVDFPHLDFFCDVKDLKRYKIEGILNSKVILAQDSKEENVKIIIKTLPKASYTTRTTKMSLLPINAKYMVKLKRYYETDEELILVIDFISPGPLFSIITPYLTEQASRMFSSASLKVSDSSAMTVITPDPEFIRSRSASLAPQNEIDPKVDQNEDLDDDLEIVVKARNDDNSENEDDLDIETELLCLSKGGIEKIECYDQEKRDNERFHMLEDHTNEIIKKLHEDDQSEESEENAVEIDPNKFLCVINHLEISRQTSSFLIPGRLLTPALSSAPISAPSTAPVSPITSPVVPYEIFHLHQIIPSFGGHDLKTAPILPMSLLKSWTVHLTKAILDLHSRRIYVQDLNPTNLLLSENGELLLTYQCQWVSVDNPLHPRSISQQYVAPEVVTLINPAPEADWWSVGVILFELYTGWSFCSLFPSGLKSHTPLIWSEDPNLRDGESELRDLIGKFLHPETEGRLTDQKEIKKHRFFVGVDWKN